MAAAGDSRVDSSTATPHAQHHAAARMPLHHSSGHAAPADCRPCQRTYFADGHNLFDVRHCTDCYCCCCVTLPGAAFAQQMLSMYQQSGSSPSNSSSHPSSPPQQLQGSALSGANLSAADGTSTLAAGDAPSTSGRGLTPEGGSIAAAAASGLLPRLHHGTAAAGTGALGIQSQHLQGTWSQQRLMGGSFATAPDMGRGPPASGISYLSPAAGQLLATTSSSYFDGAGPLTAGVRAPWGAVGPAHGFAVTQVSRGECRTPCTQHLNGSEDVHHCPATHAGGQAGGCSLGNGNCISANKQVHTYRLCAYAACGCLHHCRLCWLLCVWPHVTILATPPAACRRCGPPSCRVARAWRSCSPSTQQHAAWS